MSNPKYLKIDALEVTNQVNMLLSNFASAFEGDEELLLSTLGGETDFYEVMERIYEQKAAAESAVLGAKARESELKARRERLERKSDGLKHMMLSLMQTAQQTKVELVECTLSIRKPSFSVDVYDDMQLPQGCFEMVRKPDKKLIKMYIDSGDEVPGARLVEGEYGLTIKKG